MARQQATRREFLRRSVAASTVFSVPLVVPDRVFGANEKIITGHIGMGGRGGGNLRAFLNHAVAVCDVDANRVARSVKQVENAGNKCAGYSDYRKLLDRGDLDAVVISTPDHWHALPAIEACQAEIDVYCEKPLTLTIREGREMVTAVRDNKRILQTGSQQRSSSNFRLACELVRSGRIGTLEKVLVGIPGPNHPGKPIPDSKPPSELDYDLWLGPAPLRPYNKNRVHYNFRFFRDYSGGQMTNWGAHHIDIAHWGMGVDDSGPLAVHGEAKFHPEKWHDVTESCRITYKYPNDVVMIVGQKQADIPGGTTFVGSKGSIFVNRGKLSSNPESIIKQPLEDGDVRLQVSSNHYQDFLNSIKTRQLPICDVEIGHRTATACHLGNAACELGREIRWDAKSERVIGDEEAQQHLTRPYRAPWKLV